MMFREGQLKVFIGLFIAICLISTCSFIEVLELKKALAISESKGLSDDFKYLKDFSDRNVEVFSVVTSVFATVIVLIVGWGFRDDYNRKISLIEDAVNTFTSDQTRQNILHTNQIKNALNVTGKKFGDVFNMLANSTYNTDNELSIFLRLSAIQQWFLGYKDGYISENEVNSISEGPLNEIIQDIGQGVITNRSINLYNEDILESLMVNSPRKIRLLTNSACSEYKKAIDALS